MTGLSGLLPDFGHTGGSTVVEDWSPSDQQAEDINPLTSFENGYQAGWDDAVAAAGHQTSKADQELVNALVAISGSVDAARAHVLQSLEPLLVKVVDTVLPEIGRETLGLHVLSNLRPMIAETTDRAAVVSVNAGAARRLEPLFDAISNPRITLKVQDTLDDGQANLAFAGQEARLDLNTLCTDLRQAIDAILFENRKDLAYGT